MAKTILSLVAIAIAALAGVTLAHPHPHELSEVELAKRAEFEAITYRGLSACRNKHRARGLTSRSAARRQAFAEQARRDLGLNSAARFLGRRDLETVLATNHEQNDTDYTTDSNPFEGNSTCILQPEIEEGPYYVEGEYIRSNISEGQPGVPLYFDVEFIDVDTCEPATGIYMDVWHANATGVYAGVIAEGNGVGESDPSNINKTFLRGVQATNDEGYVQFISVFPGHYDGRTTHIHVIAHQTDGTVNENGTYSTGTAMHVGQFFFDQNLVYEVESLDPYVTNTINITENADDRCVQTAAATMDPMMDYVLLGDSLEDGLFAWISLGINKTAVYTLSPAANLTAEGGVENDSSSSGDTPSGSGMPSGSMSMSGTPTDSSIPSETA